MEAVVVLIKVTRVDIVEVAKVVVVEVAKVKVDVDLDETFKF
jgi:hypothetical protein